MAKTRADCDCTVLKFEVPVLSGLALESSESEWNGLTFPDFNSTEYSTVTKENFDELWNYFNEAEERLGFIPTNIEEVVSYDYEKLSDNKGASFISAMPYNIMRLAIEVMRNVDNPGEWTSGSWMVVPAHYSAFGELLNEPSFVHIDHTQNIRNNLCFKRGYFTFAECEEEATPFYMTSSGTVDEGAETEVVTGAYDTLTGIDTDPILHDIWVCLTGGGTGNAGAIRRFTWDGTFYGELGSSSDNPDFAGNLLCLDNTGFESSDGGIPDYWSQATFTKREVGYFNLIGDQRLEQGRRL